MKCARWFLTAAGAATVIGLAAPVHADNTDPFFLNELDRAGIEYADPQGAISTGREVCNYLQAGHPVNSAARALKIANHHLSMHNATQFVALAQEAYCPMQIPPDGGGV
jgi:hypothetical protein